MYFNFFFFREKLYFDSLNRNKYTKISLFPGFECIRRQFYFKLYKTRNKSLQKARGAAQRAKARPEPISRWAGPWAPI